MNMFRNRSSSGKFSIALRFFHWTGLLIMLGVYVSAWSRKLYENGTDERALVMGWHVGLGILVLVWLLFRLLAYFTSAKPPILPQQPSWQSGALKLMHGLLWGLMLVLPLAGWLATNAKGRPMNLSLVGIQLPTLVEKNDTLAKMLGGAHEPM